MDAYIHRKLLFKCDNSIAKIYSNIIKMMIQNNIDQGVKQETIKQIDVVLFQIFKYKTALLSLQKDIHDNEETQIKADEEIMRSKEEIKNLTEQVKSAEIVRRRKLQFNEVAKSVKQFETNEQLSQKIKYIESQVQKLNAQYQMQICLKIALSALRVLMKEDGAVGVEQSPLNVP